jgi:DNA-binding Lrp family transcriptional regulator
MVPGMTMDRTDRELLQAAQEAVPLEKRPWNVMGEMLGIPEGEVLERLKSLHEEGVLSSVAPILEANRVGLYASTLVAMQVPEERLQEVAGIVNEYEGVSHNYQRDHQYNLWFTLTMPDDDSLAGTLEEILERTGIPESDVLDLPIIRRFKIGVRFRFVSDEAYGGNDGLH